MRITEYPLSIYLHSLIFPYHLGYDVSLLVDVTEIQSDKGKLIQLLVLITVVLYCTSFTLTLIVLLNTLLDTLVKNFSLLKRNCVACVFEKYFDLQKQYEEQGVQNKEFAIINYREDETL